MRIPGFTATASLSGANAYRARANRTASCVASVQPQLFIGGRGGFGSGLGVNYPPTGCLLCTEHCFPFPCVTYPPDGDGCEICFENCVPVPCEY